MILATTKSKNGVDIRLTDERFNHIIYSHKEINVLDLNKIILTVNKPYAIFEGKHDELMATAKFEKNKWIVVVYKETNQDGFVITAYLTTDTSWLFNRKIIWISK